MKIINVVGARPNFMKIAFIVRAMRPCEERDKRQGGRMRFASFVIIGLFVFLFSDIFTQTAYAYLDPGTGSYVFQLIIAAVIGGLFAIKLSWKKIIIFFKGLFAKRKKNG